METVSTQVKVCASFCRWLFPGLVLGLPLLLCGCLTTATVDGALHGSATFVPDNIKQVAKAFVTPDDELVILVMGKNANTSSNGPFTIRVSLPANKESNEVVWVHRESVVAGWDAALLKRADLFPVAIAPRFFPTAEDLEGNWPRFPGAAGAEHTLYPTNPSPEKEAVDFCYVEAGPNPRKLYIVVQYRDIRTSHSYPMFLLIPVTVPLDIALSPFELYGILTYGDHEPPPNLISSEK